MSAPLNRSASTIPAWMKNQFLNTSPNTFLTLNSVCRPVPLNPETRITAVLAFGSKRNRWGFPRRKKPAACL